jgi:hypothetical protein
MPSPVFSVEEDAIVRSGWADRLQDRQIAQLLAAGGFDRTDQAVKKRRSVLHLVAQHGGRRDVGKPIAVKPIDNLSPDRRFKMAMLAAIHDGTETPIMGVVRDYRPIILKSIRPEPQGSCVGSAAQQCADA